jgi:hypothetical protein
VNRILKGENPADLPVQAPLQASRAAMPSTVAVTIRPFRTVVQVRAPLDLRIDDKSPGSEVRLPEPGLYGYRPGAKVGPTPRKDARDIRTDKLSLVTAYQSLMFRSGRGSAAHPTLQSLAQGAFNRPNS